MTSPGRRPSDVPPMSEIEGVDLVTEGVVTMSRVVEYAQDYLGQRELRAVELRAGRRVADLPAAL